MAMKMPSTGTWTISPVSASSASPTVSDALASVPGVIVQDFFGGHDGSFAGYVPRKGSRGGALRFLAAP